MADRTHAEAPVPKPYPYLEDVNEGVVRQLPRVGADRRPRVLDLGCGGGALGSAIRSLGYEVWGVEREPPAVARAEGRLDRVIVADLGDVATVATELGSTRVDYLVFSDVLEHMAEPLATLQAYLPYLAHGGRVIISLPNVANWQTRFALAAGRFEYQDTGVLDRTHLRFFTFASAVDLVDQAGLTLQAIDSTPMLVRALLPLAKRRLTGAQRSDADPARAIIDSPMYKRYLRWIYPMEYRISRIRPQLFAFRIVMVASADRGLSEPAPQWTEEAPKRVDPTLPPR